MKCVLIYNPNSGSAKKLTKRLDYIKERLCEKFDVLDIVPTRHEGHATEIAAAACGKYDYLILCGGDGTFNEVINGVAGKPNSPILGYIPCGTVCDMAKNLKMSRNIKKSVNLILNGDVVRHDVCKINDKHFIYVAAIGGYTAISYGLKSASKKTLGKLAYFTHGIGLVFKVKNKPMHIKVTIGDEIYEGDYSYAFVANTTSIGGFRLNAGAKLNDGMVDLILIKKSFLNGMLKILKMFTFGVVRLNDRNVKKFVIPECSIEFEEKRVWNLDGEEGIVGSAHFKVLKEDVRVIVAKEMEEWF